jgi:urocanate hydratase
MYFFDYGNAFLLEASRAGADIYKEVTRLQSYKVTSSSEIVNLKSEIVNQPFRYPSYVQDIMGPMCFDYGFGPFRWVCTSGKAADLDTSDCLAMEVLEELAQNSPAEIQ